MPIEIREARMDELDALKNLTVLAFEPIFASFAEILGHDIYAVVYPDWKKLQSDLVASFCENEKSFTWVADADGTPAGLIVFKFNDEEKTGEIEFLVVHPEYQNDGIGTMLNEFALQKMREANLKVAVVGTGGDASHAPARRAYEKAGFKPLPSVWYFKKLD